ncbi:ROK family protein [Fulvivirgaceae bacterium BMA10]|uniref:ROK family protein n=1 Tax=Splendidivirga corallicola TaxID=3051826 RepID=A0ABT8KJ20_9BACT|nr:ROK family protein [Fulvivirgaceae bacterium BMA10]
MKEVVLGIDIGGTNTKFGFVDRSGTLLSEHSISTNVHASVESFLDALHENIEKNISALGEVVELIGIGVGAPNGNYYDGTIENAPNLRWKGSVNFVKLLQSYYDIPAVLTNDANAAAIGEMRFGGAQEMKNFIVITLGTGLGSGIVVNGELIYGHDGMAGELGHTLVNVNGRYCACGKRGCLETYVSATGIKRTIYKLLADHNGTSELNGVSFNDLSAELITEAAKNGDKIALEAFEYTGRILGMKLSDAVAHTSPEAIFLFGGLTKAEDFIFEPTKRYMEENLLYVYRNKVKLLPSGLQDKNAAVLGAAALAWQELEKSKDNVY